MTGGTRRGPLGRALLAVIRFYSRAVSPALPARCRFYPTCSAYAAEAVETHGAARGAWLALRRLAKCAPWHPGGVDLVPPARTGTSEPHHAWSPTTAERSPGTRPPSTTPPASPRASQEESSLA
jgi:uncharacterized protein